jgi:hypothetical protein
VATLEQAREAKEEFKSLVGKFTAVANLVNGVGVGGSKPYHHVEVRVARALSEAEMSALPESIITKSNVIVDVQYRVNGSVKAFNGPE